MKSTLKNRVIRALSPLGVRSRMLVAVALAGAVVTACDVHGVSDPGSLASISVTPNATLASTSTVQMVAVGRDGDGRVVSISPTWSVNGIAGAVNASGMFTAGPNVGVFANSVVASVGTITGSATITVTPGIIATITVVPTPITMAVTATQQFVAVAKDAAGNVVPFIPTWSVVAGGGSIDGVGNFTAGGAPGTYTNTVQASNNAIKGFATVIVTLGPVANITVTPNPDTLIVSTKQQFVATGKDVSGNTVVMAVVWSVVANGGTVDANGMFTAGATPGTFTNTVKATSGSLSGTATVVVTAGALASIKVTPTPDTLAIIGTQQFTATGSDAAGNPVVITPVWTVVAGGGSITPTGLFTAGTISGTFTNTVKATSGALTGFATVVVKPGAIVTMTVTPNPANMLTNANQLFLAVAKDANLNNVPIVPVWQVVNGGGVIDPVGNFTSGNVAGTFTNTIQATSGLLSAFATVNVTSPIVPPLVDFGPGASAGLFAYTALTCVTAGIVNADIMLSPGSTVSGFGPGGCTLSGTMHLNDAVAKSALTADSAAFQQLLGMTCPPGNAIVADMGGTTKTAGVYCTNSTMQVTGHGAAGLTLDGGGNPNANFVFQAKTITGAMTTAGDINLINGAQAKNVYWVVQTSATLGTASIFAGNIVAGISVTMVNTATLTGRIMALGGSIAMGNANVITLP